MSKRTYDRWSRVIAFLLKVIGVLGIIFVPVFWAFTQRIELALLPFFASLTTAGLGVDVLREIAEGRIKLPPEKGKEDAA